MALPRAVARNSEQGVRRQPKGREHPRIAPPTPARTKVADFEAEAACSGLTIFPWQKRAGRYLYAVGSDGRWLFPEVAIIVARQNGKTTELVPFICDRLRRGRRLMHTAQNRELPREVFGLVVDHMQAKHRDEIKGHPRFANGQEEIRTRNGGHYRIVAPTRGGARGPSCDDVLVDELREMGDFDFIAAAKPTMTAAPNPQIVYLSNAGTETSAVLNALKKRAAEDPRLAYLEWSAAPERKPDDRAGWYEANPSLGHMPQMLSYLEGEFRTNQLADTMAIFETEHLCRWVVTMHAPLVKPGAWESCEVPVDPPNRPVLGLSMDPSGTRASGVIAWMQSDGIIANRVVADVTGSPIDLERLGPDLRALALRLRVVKVVYDPYTEPLARYFPSKLAEIQNGSQFVDASGEWARRVESGRLHWADDGAVIGDDLPWATRRAVRAGVWMAVKAKDEHPITAVLAAIRATWPASNPNAPGEARVY